MVQRAVRDSIKDRSIKDIDQEGEVTIVRKGVHEPTLRRSSTGGNRDHILPGNREYVEGDKIPRPPGGAGQGAGSQAGTGEGEDEFRFVLTREEFLALFLDDLERSEEHTSELQSLMRSSSAVFGLKKKNKIIVHP